MLHYSAHGYDILLWTDRDVYDIIMVQAHTHTCSRVNRNVRQLIYSLSDKIMESDKLNYFAAVGFA